MSERARALPSPARQLEAGVDGGGRGDVYCRKALFPPPPPAPFRTFLNGVSLITVIEQMTRGLTNERANERRTSRRDGKFSSVCALVTAAWHESVGEEVNLRRLPYRRPKISTRRANMCVYVCCTSR